MFTKIGLPAVRFYLLERGSALMMGKSSHAVVRRSNGRPWLALCLVLGAHLAAFTALRPQPQSLAAEPAPEPIMVSLLSTPQAAPQQPMPPIKPVAKPQKPVKTPIRKAAVPRVKQAALPATPPVEPMSIPAAETRTPVVEPETQVTQPTDNKPVLNAAEAAAEMQTYQSPSFNAAYLNNPPPAYPSISRRVGEQGLVLLRVQVTEDGAASSVVLQTGSGSNRLDKAALEAVKKWRFTPAKRGERPVSASVIVPVRFSIAG